MKTETKKTVGGERQGIKLDEIEYQVISLENTEPDAALAEAIGFVNDSAKAAGYIVAAINDEARTAAVNTSGVADVTTAVARIKRVGKDVTPERVTKMVAVLRRQREELAEALA